MALSNRRTLLRIIASGHQTKNTDKDDDTYETILTKTRDESLGERVRGRILAGNYYLLEEFVVILDVYHSIANHARSRNYEKYYVQSQRVRRGLVNDYKHIFEEDKIDCLLAPVVSSDPVTLAEYEQSDDIFSDDDAFTVDANLAGMDTITSRGLLITNARLD